MLRLGFTFLMSVIGAYSMAQDRTASHCLAFAQNGPPVHLASSGVALQKDQVRISYVEHSMYQIDTFGGLSVVTDYAGLGGRVVPDVVTMNKGHTSHYTSFPDDRIKHVLRGWDLKGGIADHYLDLGEMIVRNVTTDIRSNFTGREPDGNSIFIFEVGGLCIGHLGHLHHIPSDAQFARIGRLDVVMAAVDGGMTLDTPSMVQVMKRFNASVVLPMHWFGRYTLETFLAGMRADFDIVELDQSNLIVSLDKLPRRPTIFVMPPNMQLILNRSIDPPVAFE